MTMNGLPPVAKHIFLASKNGFDLVGAYCDNCKKHFFPIREHCSSCLGDTGQVKLGSRGKIYSFTVVRTKPPFGLPRPYGVAYIDLEAIPLRVFGLLDPHQLDRIGIGMPVNLSVGPMGVNNDGHPCLRPNFRLLPDPSKP